MEAGNVKSTDVVNKPLQVPVYLAWQRLAARVTGLGIALLTGFMQTDYVKKVPFLPSLRFNLLGSLSLTALAYGIMQFGQPSQKTMKEEQAIVDYVNASENNLPVTYETGHTLCANPNLLERVINHLKERGTSKFNFVPPDTKESSSILSLACSSQYSNQAAKMLLDAEAVVTPLVVTKLSTIDLKKSTEIFQHIVKVSDLKDLNDHNKALIFIGLGSLAQTNANFAKLFGTSEPSKKLEIVNLIKKEIQNALFEFAFEKTIETVVRDLENDVLF